MRSLAVSSMFLSISKCDCAEAPNRKISYNTSLCSRWRSADMASPGSMSLE